MTQSTGQERTEVIYTDQGINVAKDGVLVAFIPWEQAASRALVVPCGPCAICGSDEPYTGTCGSNDPRALCKKPSIQPPEVK